MLQPHMMELMAKERMAAVERQLAKRQLLRDLNASQPTRPAALRRTGQWVGVQMVRVGTQLQRYGTVDTATCPPEGNPG